MTVFHVFFLPKEEKPIKPCGKKYVSAMPSLKKIREYADFFMKQLQLIGGEQSVEAVKSLSGKQGTLRSCSWSNNCCWWNNCRKNSCRILKNKDLPCAASVMNTLASMNSEIAVNEYISWSQSGDANIKGISIQCPCQERESAGLSGTFSRCQRCFHTSGSRPAPPHLCLIMQMQLGRRAI